MEPFVDRRVNPDPIVSFLREELSRYEDALKKIQRNSSPGNWVHEIANNALSGS